MPAVRAGGGRERRDHGHAHPIRARSSLVPRTGLSSRSIPNTGRGAPCGISIVIGRRVFALRQAGVGSDAAIWLPWTCRLDRAQVSGAVAIGGWALDDLEVARVLIYREAPFAGGACEPRLSLDGSVRAWGTARRSSSAYPTMPRNDRAGFGFMILTNMLPNQSNGLIPHSCGGSGCRSSLDPARVTDDLLLQRLRHSAVLHNRHASTELDYRLQNYLNFGCALTPQPAMIPTDRSSIQVIVYCAPVFNPTYNLFLPDVVRSLFQFFAYTILAC